MCVFDVETCVVRGCNNIIRERTNDTSSRVSRCTGAGAHRYKVVITSLHVNQMSGRELVDVVTVVDDMKPDIIHSLDDRADVETVFSNEEYLCSQHHSRTNV